MLVLETQIENVSSAAQRERYGKVEGQKKSKIKATANQGTESFYRSIGHKPVCKDSGYLKENFLLQDILAWRYCW